MLKIDLYSAIPIYQQIVDEYKRLIVNGILKNGDKIPSIRELAATLGINPSTVSKAYTQMENDLIIKVSRGRGTFIYTEEYGEENIYNEIKQQFKPVINSAKNLKVEKKVIYKIVDELYEETINEN